MSKMALTGKPIKEKVDGVERDAFQVTFNNGTYEQLKQLSAYLQKEKFNVTDDPTDVVKIGISFLLSVKEQKEKEGHD